VSDKPRENRVREHRKATGITQAELARAGGVSRQSIVSVEGGDYAPSVYLAVSRRRWERRSKCCSR
jgi:putative transcriptional regulator